MAAVKTTSNLKTRGLESLAYFLQPPKQRINRAEFKFIAATLTAKVNIMVLLKVPLNELILAVIAKHNLLFRIIAIYRVKCSHGNS